MDGKILDLFMKENDAWDDLISRQYMALEIRLMKIFRISARSR